MTSRTAGILVVLVAVAIVGGWLLWAWLSGGFCTPPPGAACL